MEVVSLLKYHSPDNPEDYQCLMKILFAFLSPYPLVFDNSEPPGVKALQTDPSGHQQEWIQLHAPGLLLAFHSTFPEHLRGQTSNNHYVSTCISGGTASGPKQYRKSLHAVYVFYFCVQVLDLSHNNLKDFLLVLPALRELHLSGNKLLRLPAGWLFPNLQTLSIQVRTNHMSSLFLKR